MSETLLDALRGEAGAPALMIPGGPEFTYDELRSVVADAAGRLAGLGVRPGDRVAMAFPNGPEAIVMFLAASLAGTACPLNPAYKEDEFAFYLEDTDTQTLLLPRGEGAAARQALQSVFGERGRVVEVGFDSAGRLELDGANRDPELPDSDEVALVLHTSGTTSRPKRVPLRHRNLLASVANIQATYRLGPEDVSLCIMPLFHVHGLMASTLATLYSGGTVVAPARFNPLGFWPVARAHRPTWYSASPTFHHLILLRSEDGRPAGSERLRFVRSCSSTLAPAFMAEMEERLGAPVLDAYGMTEASHQMASNPLPPEPRKPGSVGRGTGVEIGIMDDGGRLLAPGEPGEVVIRGANVIDGYEGNPEANATSFTEGWFRTGDRGSLDGAGYLTLIGRIKELINRGGEKIAPVEIDEVLEAHPKVKEAVAFAQPHPAWGEEVAVAVVLKEPVSEKELTAWCRERLAEFKVPRKIHLVDEIPRTATGKVQRRNVAAAFNGE
ncbi:MAG TPA: acyl--CoA ligase [Candidatus Dormibacteraeota bacterium]